MGGDRSVGAHPGLTETRERRVRLLSGSLSRSHPGIKRESSPKAEGVQDSREQSPIRRRRS